MERYKLKRNIIITIIVVVNLISITAKSVGSAISRQLSLDIKWNLELLLKTILIINGSILLLFGVLILHKFEKFTCNS